MSLSLTTSPRLNTCSNIINQCHKIRTGTCPSYLVSFLQNFNYMLVSSPVLFSVSLKSHNSKKHITKKTLQYYIYIYIYNINILVLVLSIVYMYLYQTTGHIIRFITIKPPSNIQFWYVVLHIFVR